MYTLRVENEDGEEVVAVSCDADEVIKALASLMVEADEEEETVAAPTKEKKQRKVRSCSQCGGPGHTARTCGKTSAPEVQAGPLTEAEFNSVKENQAEGIGTNKEVAESLGLNVKEVRTAWQHETHAEYLAAR